jgi:hypothetical protein
MPILGVRESQSPTAIVARVQVQALDTACPAGMIARATTGLISDEILGKRD